MDAKELWKRYEAGIAYNSNFKLDKDYYEAIKVWNNFYNGDQWIGVEAKDLPKPVFNFIKRVIEFKIASLTNADIAVNVEPLENTPVENQENILSISDVTNAEIKNIFEKWNFRVKKKEILQEGAITGDMCFHFLFDMSKKPFRGAKYDKVQGEMEIELIDSTNVLFGNANIRDVEKQPYIILVGRDTVKNLKKEAEQFKNSNADEIKDDNDTQYFSSDFANTEVEIQGDNEGKAKYIYYYYKKDGKVFVTKCTENAIIYENVDTGYSYYPIAFSNWYKQKNTYHGRGEVEGLCPNQIIINKMFAMIVYHQMLTAFPIAIFDGEVLDDFPNEIGSAIKMHGLNGKNYKDVAGYLNPANMSDYIIKVIDLAFQYTKECMGVSDASLGNIDPKNTSAIIAVQKSTAVPLENIKDNLYDLVEQTVRIMIDIMGSKYGNRPIVITDENGTRQIVLYDFSQLKEADLHLSIDVGEGSYYSDIAVRQTLDNLLTNGFIEFIDYLERMPNEAIPKKAELINKIKQAQQQQMQANNDAMYEEMAKYMESLPKEQQEQLKQLPPEELEQTIMKMMGGVAA